MMAAVAAKISFLSLAALSFTGAIPFVLVVLWLGQSDIGKRIRSWFEIWHLRVFAASILFCYVTYGQKWAGDIINELFNLDARYFGSTATVLTVLFAPFGLLYRPEIIGSIFDLFNITAALVIPFYFLYLLVAEDIQSRGKKIGYLFLTVFLTTLVLALAFNISKSFKSAIKAFALWADFNESHLCMDSWGAEAKSVLFLDNGKVLGYFPSAKGYQFKVMPCDYAKKF